MEVRQGNHSMANSVVEVRRLQYSGRPQIIAERARQLLDRMLTEVVKVLPFPGVSRDRNDGIDDQWSTGEGLAWSHLQLRNTCRSLLKWRLRLGGVAIALTSSGDTYQT